MAQQLVKILFIIIAFVLFSIKNCYCISDIANVTITETTEFGEFNSTSTDNQTDGYKDNNYIPYDLQIIIDAFNELNPSSKCLHDGNIILNSIRKKEKWALKIFDASAKYPVGILHGAYYQMGNFDECIETKVDGIANFQTQYCLADIELNQLNTKRKSRHTFNNTIHWAICAPSSCTIDEIQIIVKQIFVVTIGQQDIEVGLDNNKCYIDTNLPLNHLEIIYGSLIGLFIVFILFATIFHYNEMKKNKQLFICNTTIIGSNSRTCVLKEIICCFSLIKNMNNLLNCKKNDLHLECICGVKFLSMGFIIAGHSIVFILAGPVLNTKFHETQVTFIPNALISNSPLLVDTFLLISGFLMCYLLLLELDKRKGRVNVLILYIARYIRLTPSYLVIIGLYCSYLYRMGNGPLWAERIGNERDRCLNSWWTNLLYINNYINTDNICMFQSWYLAADYHLFIIAPLIIYPLWQNNLFGKLLLGLSTIISIIVPFCITYIQKFDPTLMGYAPEVQDITRNYYYVNAYIKTHMRASAYCIGLTFGYLLYKMQINGTKIRKSILWLGWLILPSCSVISMCSIVVFYTPGHQYDALESAFYAVLHRIGWCIGLCWLLFVCITNNAPIINRFLSWKPFIVLSRLTYSAYLVNGFVEIYSYGIIRDGVFQNKWETGNRLISHIVFTFVFALILCILFESPIHGMEKILLRKADVKTNTNNNNNHAERLEENSTT